MMDVLRTTIMFFETVGLILRFLNAIVDIDDINISNSNSKSIINHDHIIYYIC